MAEKVSCTSKVSPSCSSQFEAQSQANRSCSFTPRQQADKEWYSRPQILSTVAAHHLIHRGIGWHCSLLSCCAGSLHFIIELGKTRQDTKCCESLTFNGAESKLEHPNIRSIYQAERRKYRQQLIRC